MQPTDLIGNLDKTIKKEFEANRRVLTFEEYLVVVKDSPENQLRGSAKYTLDMFDYFKKTPIEDTEGPDSHLSGLDRFHLFEKENTGYAHRKVVGQDVVENQVYRALKSFVGQGINNRLILLHGPNGSAKTSLITAAMLGMEEYSHQPEGAIYTFNWVFPVERFTKGNLGITQSNYETAKTAGKTATQSFAKLSDEDILCKISCELKDHPILLLPIEHRKEMLTTLLGEAKADEIWNALPQYLKHGELCQRCKQIFEALLTSNNGDFRKVLMHAQVERFFFSNRYRKGLVTIEPQMHVDAQAQQLTMSRTLGNLPPSLQSLSLFTMTGDLIDGNRGIIQYSDLLKRPVDTFKYLLMACESGTVTVGHSIAALDTVFIGSANELQLDAFKEFPDFMSFKARIELIRVPYVLSMSQEAEIYEPDVKQIGRTKHVSPHTAWSLACWAVLSRLKKPNGINYQPQVSSLISALTPIEKARLYDHGEMPLTLTAEDRKYLRSAIRALRDEYESIPYYEGRMGASAREMKSVLYSSAQNTHFKCLSPLSIFNELEEFVKRVSEYEFLKQDVKDSYHDCVEFIEIVRNEYLNHIDREVRDSIGLYDSNQWEDFLKKYVQHISLILKKEKIKNQMTGELEDPDLSLVQEFETIVGVSQDQSLRDTFRQSIISGVGAWALDHPREPVVYAKVFPEYWQKLEKHYFSSQKALLEKMHNALIFLDSLESSPSTIEERKLASRTIDNMVNRFHYCPNCAKEVIAFLIKKRY